MKRKSNFTLSFLCLSLIVLTRNPKTGFGKEFSRSELKKFQTGLPSEISQLKDNSIRIIELQTTNFKTFHSIKGEGQHFFGRYVITLMGSVGLWSITVATSSLIANGTLSPSREWFEDYFWWTARPSMVVGSSTISMLLFKHKRVKTFLSLVAINSAVLTASYFGGKLVNDEADVLLQLTTTFFIVPLISTMYNHAFSEKEDLKIGNLQINLPEPSIQIFDKELWIGGRVSFEW
jgi:hypothetical protein